MKLIEVDGKKVVQVSLDDFPMISVSKNVCLGSPVFQGTRTFIVDAITTLKEGKNIEDYLADFAAVRYEQVQELLEVFERIIIEFDENEDNA